MAKRPDTNDPRSRASRFRRARFRRLDALLRGIVAKKGRARVLDIGGRRDYWRLLDPELAPHVELTLLNYEDELAVGRDEADTMDVTYVQGDGCAMPQYGDASFDLAHSNSVIEHVGSLENMIRFADETRRVGEAYYMQTPYLWFPIEPHYGAPFFHWLPAPTRAQLNNRFNIRYTKRREDYRAAAINADHIELVDQWLVRRLFPDGTLYRERFALMTKSLIVIRAAGFAELR
ncbi:MAG: class I SAM-dependent methyltransferase [Alphaproteobacteria bacterium]|nr:MAG: class I SAM-dependent methyltransferase [Alphaproteobacteria bacterium]